MSAFQGDKRAKPAASNAVGQSVDLLSEVLQTVDRFPFMSVASKASVLRAAAEMLPSVEHDKRPLHLVGNVWPKTRGQAWKK